MAYLAQSTHASVCAAPHSYVPQLWQMVRTIFLNDLPPGMRGMPEPINKLAFASVLAFDLKPYGGSGATTLEQCLQASALDCDNYAVLAIELFRILDGSFEPAMVGWHNGPVGNHAQILGCTQGAFILCDPTIGLVAKDVSLDGMCRGYPPMADRYRSFFHFNSDRQEIASFNSSVVSAVLSGSFMASHVLYWFPSVDDYRAASGSASWATPQSWNVS